MDASTPPFVCTSVEAYEALLSLNRALNEIGHARFCLGDGSTSEKLREVGRVIIELRKDIDAFYTQETENA